MDAFLQIVLGAAFGGAFVLLARGLGPRREDPFIALGLVGAALVYGAFAVVGAGEVVWLVVEAVGVILYGVVAWLGLRRSAWWLTLGWATHTAWDVALHLGDGTAFVPSWYPLACGSFDLLVGAYVAVRLWKTRPTPA